jgi:hypothetical protein
VEGVACLSGRRCGFGVVAAEAVVAPGFAAARFAAGRRPPVLFARVRAACCRRAARAGVRGVERREADSGEGATAAAAMRCVAGGGAPGFGGRAEDGGAGLRRPGLFWSARPVVSVRPGRAVGCYGPWPDDEPESLILAQSERWRHA